MKCIKNIKYGHINRVSNEDAQKLVASGGFKYVPKHEWKEQR